MMGFFNKRRIADRKHGNLPGWKELLKRGRLSRTLKDSARGYIILGDRSEGRTVGLESEYND